MNAGDIDPSMNLVEVTPEAKAELAKIENKIGDFICRLCKEVYDDAFGLAQHRSVALHYTAYHPFRGRCFVCFVFEPCALAGSKTKHMKHLPPNG